MLRGALIKHKNRCQCWKFCFIQNNNKTNFTAVVCTSYFLFMETALQSVYSCTLYLTCYHDACITCNHLTIITENFLWETLDSTDAMDLIFCMRIFYSRRGLVIGFALLVLSLHAETCANDRYVQVNIELLKLIRYYF
jgi:hypothetical protein